MKRIFGSSKDNYLIRLSILLITIALVAAMAGCDGRTPPSKSLEIRTWYDLDAVRNNLDSSYILINDLDSTTLGYEELASRTANVGKGWQPIGHGCWVWTWFGVKEAGEIFKGILDGQGYEIRDLYIDSQEEDQVGLFGFVAKGAIIRNITSINVTVTTGKATGDQVGLNEDAVRCLDVAPVGGFGGLVGHNGGTVSNCHAMGNVTGVSGVGGLVGDNEGTMSNCSFTGTVSANEDVGTLAGANKGTLRNCYFVGNVTGKEVVGGLVGFNRRGTVSNSYYNYDEVLINGENIISIGALLHEDRNGWPTISFWISMIGLLKKVVIT
jgi:hypothetical protein